MGTEMEQQAPVSPPEGNHPEGHYMEISRAQPGASEVMFGAISNFLPGVGCQPLSTAVEHDGILIPTVVLTEIATRTDPPARVPPPFSDQQTEPSGEERCTAEELLSFIPDAMRYKDPAVTIQIHTQNDRIRAVIRPYREEAPGTSGTETETGFSPSDLQEISSRAGAIRQAALEHRTHLSVQKRAILDILGIRTNGIPKQYLRIAWDELAKVIPGLDGMLVCLAEYRYRDQHNGDAQSIPFADWLKTGYSKHPIKKLAAQLHLYPNAIKEAFDLHHILVRNGTVQAESEDIAHQPKAGSTLQAAPNKNRTRAETAENVPIAGMDLTRVETIRFLAKNG